MLGTNRANVSFLSSGLQEFLSQVIASLTDITPAVLQLYKLYIDSCGWFPAFLVFVFIHILNVPSFLEGNTSPVLGNVSNKEWDAEKKVSAFTFSLHKLLSSSCWNGRNKLTFLAESLFNNTIAS